MVRYKIDIMRTLADAGYSRIKLRNSKTLSQSTMQTLTDAWKIQTLPDEEIRKDERLQQVKETGIGNISLGSLNRICIMCGLRIEDVVEIVPTDEEIIDLYKVKTGYT